VHESNCIEFSESERGALTLGDACDPVPCPYSKAVENFFVGIHELPTPGGDGVTGTKRSVRNRIEHELVGSRSMINGFGMKQDSVRTEYRFCQQSEDSKRECSPKNRQVGDDDFEGDDVYDATKPDRVRWRRVTMGPVSELGYKGYTKYLDYPSKTTGGYWNY